MGQIENCVPQRGDIHNVTVWIAPVGYPQVDAIADLINKVPTIQTSRRILNVGKARVLVDSIIGDGH